MRSIVVELDTTCIRSEQVADNCQERQLAYPDGPTTATDSPLLTRRFTSANSCRSQMACPTPITVSCNEPDQLVEGQA